MKGKTLITCTALCALLAAPVLVSAAQESEPGSMSQQSQQSSMQSQEQSQLMNMKVSQITGKPVTNIQGNELGDVDKLVQDPTDNSVQAVVSVGGFLGIGSKKIAIPIDQLQLQDNKLVWNQAITKDQLKEQPEYQQAQYQDIQGDRVLAEVTGGGGQAQVAFQQLDTNQDGVISQEEAQSDQQLYDNFAQADQNSDSQIDRSEFSAFEQSRSEPPSEPGMQQEQQQQPGASGEGGTMNQEQPESGGQM